MKTKPLFWTVASVLILPLVGSLPGVAQDANQSAPPAGFLPVDGASSSPRINRQINN